VTSQSRFFVRVLVALLSVALALASVSASAQALAGLPAVVNVGGSGLDAGRVKGALERELGVSLRIDPSAEQRLEVVVTGRRANVTYYAPGREPVTRSVDLPKDEERATETIAFLVGNLARDEAQALLDELKAREAPPPPPPPPPPAPAEPAPTAAAKAPVPPKAAAAAAKKAPAAPSDDEPKEPELTKTPLNLSLYYPVTLLPNTEKRRVNFELGLVYSQVGAIQGFALNLGHLRVNHSVRGATYALIWNRAGRVRGVQNGLIFNEGYGRLEGASTSALVNLRDGDVYGLQLSGIVNWARLETGAQVSGLVGLTGATEGLQLAGLLTYSSGRVRGGQIAGLMAVANDVTGSQVSSTVNIAKDVQGLQVSLVNVGKKVSGMQIGLVNVAEEIDGGALGLVSVAGNGHVQGLTWLSGGAATSVNGAVKFLTGYTYSYIGGGHELAQPRARAEAGLGLHVPLRPLFFEVGPAYAGEWEDKNTSGDPVRQELRYDLRAGVELARHISLFAGGGLAHRLTGEGKDFRGEWSFGAALF